MPREVDPLVYNMSIENAGDVSYAEIGGLSEQIRELREVVGISLYHSHAELVLLKPLSHSCYHFPAASHA